MIVPKAAIAQIIARSPKLAIRKNPPFRSCIERGTIDPHLPVIQFYHVMRSANCMCNSMILQALSCAVSAGIEDRAASTHSCDIRHVGKLDLQLV